MLVFGRSLAIPTWRRNDGLSEVIGGYRSCEWSILSCSFQEIGIDKQIDETANAWWFCGIQATISRRICDFSYQLNP